jgi:large subunit ribosomal protein L29
MKRNDIRALADKTVEELDKQLGELQAEVTKARLSKMAGKLSNFRLIAMLRDDVARIKTVLKERRMK